MKFVYNAIVIAISAILTWGIGILISWGPRKVMEMNGAYDIVYTHGGGTMMKFVYHDVPWFLSVVEFGKFYGAFIYAIWLISYIVLASSPGIRQKLGIPF